MRIGIVSIAALMCVCSAGCRSSPPKAIPTTFPRDAPTAPMEGQWPEGATYAVDIVSQTFPGFGERKMAFARLMARCAGCAAEHAPLPLMEVTYRPVSGIFDLAGAPRTYAHQSAAEDDLPNHTTEAMRFPVALVQLAHHPKEGPSQSELFLIALPTDAHPKRVRIVWRHTLSYTNPKGGGFSTIDSVRFVRSDDAAPDAPLAIELSSTSTPAPGDTPYMPGPPILERYVYDGQTYDRVESPR